MGVAATDLQPELLAAADWGALPDALPVMVLSLVYHNVIPSIATSLEGDPTKIRWAGWRPACAGTLPAPAPAACRSTRPASSPPPAAPARPSRGAPPCRQAIVLGLSLPLGMFLVWDGVVLGGSGGAAMLQAGGAAGGDPLAALRSTSGTAAGLVDAFAFLAVATSFIGFLLGLTEFLSDALQVTCVGHRLH